MEKIKTLRPSDIGRIAVSENGYYRVRVLSDVGKDRATVENLRSTLTLEKGSVSVGFRLLSGREDMYWEDSESVVDTSLGQMSNIQYLLTKLAEECTEIGQMAAKCQQFGLDEVYSGDGNTATNRERLHAEINDLLGVIDLFNEEEGFDFVRDGRAISAKKEKIKKYRGYSISLGLVKGENR